MSECPVRPCVGCGYCCRKSPCVLAYITYGIVTREDNRCLALKWDGSRYWCELCRDPEKGEDRRKGLAIGDGCCCPLNSDRQNIPPPPPPEPSEFTWPPKRDPRRFGIKSTNPCSEIVLKKAEECKIDYAGKRFLPPP